MVFSDTLFLFLFLPLTLGVYFFTPNRWKNYPLLLASLGFYVVGEGKYVVVMLASIGFNYALGLWVHGARAGRKGPSNLPVVVAVLLNLGMLVVFKYANFLCENLNLSLRLFNVEEVTSPSIHLPIGISFFTFQAMSYVIDVHRGEAEVQRNPFNLALYIALFPQLIAGPIVRYTTVASQIQKRSIDASLFSSGVQRFILGLAKKMVLANPAGRTADLIFALPSEQLDTPTAWLGLICYSLQIYFDFSGYSDMAIGLGRMFGFTFEENFNYPYVGRSLVEFWRRWHISLSTWFRDYLYIPLGGNRGTGARTHFNLLVVFILCGFWHGASWNFLIWGLIHGCFLILERGAFGAFIRRCPSPLRHFYVLFVIMMSWVFFRAETLSASIGYLSALGAMNALETSALPVSFFIDGELALVLVLGALGSTPLASRLAARAQGPVLPLLRATALAGLLLLCSSYIAAGTYNPFIYFRF